MIIGLGIDVVKIPRVVKAVDRFGDSFLNRVFCPEEIRWCNRKKDPFPCYAARFAAKEAVVKAMGTGFSQGITLRQICVKILESGAPAIFLRKRAKEKALALGIKTFHISLSHDTDTAVAVAVAEGEAP